MPLLRFFVPVAAAVAAVVSLTIVVKAWQAPAAQRNLNQIDYAMYFMSEVRDAAGCAMTAGANGAIQIAAGITNPALTCPDMFAWKLFAQVVREQFWVAWAEEQQNWPPQPYALCAAGQDPGAVHCCRPGASNNDAAHCPSFPGAAAVASAEQTNQALRRLHGAISPHLFGPQDEAAERRALQAVLESLGQPAASPATARRACSTLPLPDDPASMGRVFRQTNGEITVRNQPFHDYVFQQNLYNAGGVIDVFTRAAQSIYRDAPYRRADQPAGPSSPAVLSRIDFPPTAIMIKSNWLNKDLLAAIGAKYGWRWEDPQNGYIQKEMVQTVKDEQGNEYNCDGTHYLLAFHISSKDIPQWTWSTFEHVSLPGRCDYTGCNDSFGHFSSDTDLPEGSARNYVRPKTMGDGMPAGAANQVFLRDRVYAAGTIRPLLATVLRTLGIGTGGPVGRDPEPADAAWLSYRLKGTQTDFTDLTGHPTFLGHSVTEAGFVNGSSCISCHARAGTDAQGPFHLDTSAAGHSTFPLSVFLNTLGDFGYGRSPSGVPNPAWFNQSNQPPTLQVLQTDFVWGFLFARPIVR